MEEQHGSAPPLVRPIAGSTAWTTGASRYVKLAASSMLAWSTSTGTSPAPWATVTHSTPLWAHPVLTSCSGHLTSAGMEVAAKAGDARGGSLVARHAERVAEERRAAAGAALRVLAPECAEGVRARALAETRGDVEQAAVLLQAFLASPQFRPARPEPEAAAPAPGPAPEPGARPPGSRSPSPRRRKGGRRERSAGSRRERHRERGDGGDRKRRRRRQGEEEGREGREEREPAPAPKSGFGARGILKDVEGKMPEFVTWAKEVKGVDIELAPKHYVAELQGAFQEDFNTGTLAAEKYYDLAAWQRAQAGRPAAGPERTTFDDEELRRRELHAQKASQKAAAVEEARQNLLKSGKVDMMREQKRLREQQQIAYQTGNVEEAQRIAQLLMPQGDKDVEWDQKAGKFRKAGARA